MQARFYNEAAHHSKKQYVLPQIEFLGIEPRKEVVGAARGKPSMLQLAVQPAYCLAIHKVRALAFRRGENGCLEGTPALGQLYVLWGRVADPNSCHGVGAPPAYLLAEVARSWAVAGLDVNALFFRSSGEGKR